MKPCCLEIWYETNVVIRMITWEITRLEHKGDRYSQDELFKINYTCNVCKKRWSNY